jgi:hypothetical protein
VLLTILLFSLIANATYYGYTICLWFKLRGHLLPCIYKWLTQDGLADILPTALTCQTQATDEVSSSTSESKKSAFIITCHCFKFDGHLFFTSNHQILPMTVMR